MTRKNGKCGAIRVKALDSLKNAGFASLGERYRAAHRVAPR
jgi:hypothetical protein